MITIKVNNCRQCPFVINDNYFGYCGCNITDKIDLKRFEELPSDNVHELCPLKNNSYTVEYDPHTTHTG